MPRNERNMQQTLVFIKPDGVDRGLVGNIIGRFENEGFRLKDLRYYTLDRDSAEQYYAHLDGLPSFDSFVEYIISGPVVAMIWEGRNVVATGQEIIGATNSPESARPGTIRGDFVIDIGRNVIHGSDSVESATTDIAWWFGEHAVYWQPKHAVASQHSPEDPVDEQPSPEVPGAWQASPEYSGKWQDGIGNWN